MQDSKDIILKQAFNDCPVKLSVFKIHCEKALDARAGDLKYHSICWHQYITARVPEFAPAWNKQRHPIYGTRKVC